MVFNRAIQRYEHAPGKLFDPRTVNIMNEDFLLNKLKRYKVRPRINTRCFIHHDKGLSVGGYKGNRDNLTYVHKHGKGWSRNDLIKRDAREEQQETGDGVPATFMRIMRNFYHRFL